MVGDVWWDTVLLPTARGFSFWCLAAWFGAAMVTLGSELVALPEDVAVCAIAVPPRPHIKAALHEQAKTRLHPNVMAISSQCGITNRTRPPAICKGVEYRHTQN
jgi:hypothetical protein